MMQYSKPLLTSLIAVWAHSLVISVPIESAVKNCSTTGQCPANSECAITARGGNCECVSGFFSSRGVCLKAIELNQPCRDYGQCGQNAECGVDRSGKCECKRGYYASGGLCRHAISLGEVCLQGEKCVSKAECVSGRCVCSQGFYNFRGYCTRSSSAGEFCSSSNECVRNAHCSAEHMCLCDVGVANADGVCV